MVYEKKDFKNSDDWKIYSAIIGASAISDVSEIASVVGDPYANEQAAFDDARFKWNELLSENAGKSFGGFQITLIKNTGDDTYSYRMSAILND